VIVHHGLSPRPIDGLGIATSPSPSSGRHRRSIGRTRLRIAEILLVAIVIAAGVVAAVAWTTSAQHQRSAAASMSVPTADADALDWMRENLPVDAKLLTDGHPVPAGYSGSPVGSSQDWRTFDYLLTAPGIDPPLDTSVTQVWQSSVPIAIFPTVQVRRILQTPLAETLRTREADRADRLVAGTALLSNPNITASPQAQAGLTSGGLDLRAAATLTALAGAMPVYVANMEDVKAEAAAGLPARSMTVQVTNADKANTVISGMTAAFRAEQVTGTPDGTFRLHWPLRFAPLPSVN
jgi:hypothetical protein